jgi:porphobilinogen synthase
MNFPDYRPRRMRRTNLLRRMIAETRLSADDLVMPLFVRPGKGERRPIPSMAGNCQLSVDELVKEVAGLKEAGIGSAILFGIPETKDPEGSSGIAADGIVQQAIRAIKNEIDEFIVITDVCLCEYTSHGHCGILDGTAVDNDATLDALAKMALSHAQAGADMVAPSDMMDGRVGAIREALDGRAFSGVPIMAYSAKYASAFYGPFRDAAESPPQFGDRKSYQMDIANSDEALREAALDISEGADIVMVKPALPYLDIIRRVKDEFGYPVAAYCVSGEFSMIKAAAEKGWLDEKATALEMLTSIRRAGADLILTYWAKDAAGWLREE